MQDKNILYKNTSKMNDEEISIFQNFALKKSTLISSIIFVLIFAGGGVGLSFVDLTIGLTLIVCGLLGGLVLLPYLMKESVKKQNKILLGDKKYLNTFDFYEDFIQISSSATPNKESNDYEEVATQKLFYHEILKIVIYKTYLFIYPNKRQSFILSFRGMTKGTIGEVIDYLKAKAIKTIDKSRENSPDFKE